MDFITTVYLVFGLMFIGIISFFFVIWWKLLKDRNRTQIYLTKRVGDNLNIVNERKIKTSDESFTIDKSVYVNDPSKALKKPNKMNILLYEVGKEKPLPINSNPETLGGKLLSSIVKSAIYQNMFNDTGFTTSMIVMLVAIAITVVVSFYAIYQNMQLQTNIELIQRQLLELSIIIKGGAK